MKVNPLYKVIPKFIRLELLKKRVVEYLSNQELDSEKTTILNHIKKNGLAVFPYDFILKYDYRTINVEKDDENGLFYMIWEGKRLYYKDGIRKTRAQKYFNGLLLEQDVESPHRYLTKDFRLSKGDVLVDVGAAEANFTLSAIETIKKAYVFEMDPQWVKALNATFAPWQDKVEIITNYVSDITDKKHIRLDDFFKENQKVDFIKMDVEGAEFKVLEGGKKTISNQEKISVAVCTYHNQEDAEVLGNKLKSLKLSTEFSDGYMLFHYGKENVVKPPFLRKGLLRGWKN